MPCPGPRVVMGGDFNLEPGGARNPGEVEAHGALADLMKAWNLQPLHEPIATRRSTQGESRLDYFLGSPDSGRDWGIRVEWQGGLSDHCVITAMRATAKGGQGRTCTPEALR